MKQYRLREGDASAVDTKTQLTTEGSRTSPGSLNVPQGMKFITAVIVNHVSNQAAATGYSAFCRLEGPGMLGGPAQLPVGAGGMAVATGGNTALKPVRIPVNFPVVELNEIQVFGEMAGTDVGLVSMNITLEFSDAAGPGETEMKTLLVEGDLTAADTRTALITQGSITSPSLSIPAGYTKIVKVIVAATAEGLADGACNIFVRLGGNAVKGGEQVLGAGAAGRIAVQAGSDAAPQIVSPYVFEDTEIEVSPGDTIAIDGEMAGTDTGTVHIVIGLVLGK